jgi:hypothetical protein
MHDFPLSADAQGKLAAGAVRHRDDRVSGPDGGRSHDVSLNTDPLGWVNERRPADGTPI